MKKQLVIVGGLLLGAAAYAGEAPAPGGMGGMKMETPAASKVNKSTGVVKAIDGRLGTVTLAHEAVPAVQWPAMTMPFRITPELAKGLQVGQRVNFEFTASGMDGTITKISVAK